MDEITFRKLAYDSIKDLVSIDGINASGRDEVYGCTFGRDSALTILKILRVHSRNPDPFLLEICKKALLTLINLQGKEFNIESGEEPGKFIHEFRRDKYEHLINRENPWFLYPDKTLRNYDSIDATPLILIAVYKYWQISNDNEFLTVALDAVEKALNWIITFGDQDKDLLLEYSFHPQRKCGGLLVQSWTDSFESLLDNTGQMPKYPVAPIEVQGYAWLALRLWSDYYANGHPEFSVKLFSQSDKMKKVFNEKFIIKDKDFTFGVQALDGDKNQIKTITGNPLILLWSSYHGKNGLETILDEDYIIEFVKRGFLEDLFDKDAGIRTMSSSALTFNPKQDSYHNGSFWPILNGLIFEGLVNWGFLVEAQQLKQASLKPLYFFQTPIELYVKTTDGSYLEYSSPSGQKSCKIQAWSAAAALDFLV